MSSIVLLVCFWFSHETIYTVSAFQFGLPLQHSIQKSNNIFGFNVDKRSIRRKSELQSSEEEYGVGMDQNDMMETDMLIAVDTDDMIIPSDSSNYLSKKKGHTFNEDTPRGVAHRAFSVFLFNSQNKMLLTRRATSKITFPGVWTNTCCSHPLYNMKPDEVDDCSKPGVFPNFPGIKHAAIRKLQHELGISPEEVPHDNFRFLIRFHYWASDTITYGKDAPWGEHEVDYVLFIKHPTETGPSLNINDEEVEEFKYVSIDELKAMMYNTDPENDTSDLLWSPWFKGIMEQKGFEMWENLEESMKVDSKYISKEIPFFDPPKDHQAEYNLQTHDKYTGVLNPNSLIS